MVQADGFRLAVAIAAGRIEIAVRQLWTCLRLVAMWKLAIPHRQAIQSGLTEFILMTIQIAKQAVFQAFSVSFFQQKLRAPDP